MEDREWEALRDILSFVMMIVYFYTKCATKSEKLSQKGCSKEDWLCRKIMWNELETAAS